MSNIKIAGAFIFILSLILAILFNYTSKQNSINSELLNSINMQKAFTQEISKNIFYIYKNKISSHKELNTHIKNFSELMNSRKRNLNTTTSDEIGKQNKKLVKLWNEFYLSVQNFRDQRKITTAYSNIILEKTVNTIYNKNLMLVINLDRLIELHKAYFNTQINSYKNIQYLLFFLLLILLIYLFTQVKVIISFIQKFSHTSQNIIAKSTIKDLEPIEVKSSSVDLLKATNNFNFLVQKIDGSIRNSTISIEHSVKSLELVEETIEDLLDLIAKMDENNEIDKELTKKEDVLIQSLEELTTSAQQLKALKTDLNYLTTQHNINKS